MVADVAGGVDQTNAPLFQIKIQYLLQQGRVALTRQVYVQIGTVAAVNKTQPVTTGCVDILL